MRWIFVAILPLFAFGASAAPPSRMYIVSAAFSDYGPSVYYRMVEAIPQATGTSIRYTRLAPDSVRCQRRIIQMAETKSPTPLTTLIDGANPCAVQPGKLAAVVKSLKQEASVFETVSFGIVAECGSSTAILSLPDTQSLKWKTLQRRYPEIARLWELVSKLTAPFGPQDVMQERSEDDDLVLQRSGENFLPTLISGAYDAGLRAVEGESTFHALMANYHGPISKTQTQIIPQIVDAEKFEFVSYHPPTYPPLGLQARIQGQVELRLTIDPKTGVVGEAWPISGHRLLTPSAIDAAKRWQFKPGSTPESLAVKLDYSLVCR